MMTQTEVDVQLQEIIEPAKEQRLIDALSAKVLTGDVDFYQAKRAVECEDWELARKLVKDE